MNSLQKQLISLLLVAGCVLPQTRVLTADFNPHFIITDDELQDWNSMSVNDIKAFLAAKGGYLARYEFFSSDGQIKTAPEVIQKAAQTHRINPRFLMVTLQKEQSLITDPEPTQKQLDWAMGYAVCDSCSMDDPAIQKFKGFDKQVDSAAGRMRWYYNNVDQQGWIKRANAPYDIDGQTVIPANMATAFFYTYTPHLHGNENFWNIWNKWFEQTYPNSSLVKTSTDGKVYLLQDGKKRHIKNMTALITRFDPKLIIPITETELAKFAEGTPISFPNYSILRQGGTTYLLDYDTLRPFANNDVVRKFGYNPDEFVDVTAEDISGYQLGQTITEASRNVTGTLLKLKENNALYFAKDSLLFPIPDVQIAAIRFPNTKPQSITLSDIASYTIQSPLLFPDGYLVKNSLDSQVYVIENGKKRHIASEAVFNAFGFNWSNIIVTNDLTLMSTPDGDTLQLPLEFKADYVPPHLPASQSGSDATKEATDQTPEDIIALMQRTPAEKTVFVGTPFSTDINTYLVADYETGAVLAGKNIDEPRPLASLTKVMTGYQLLLDGLNMDASTEFRPEQKSEYHSYRIAEGERVRNSDLMAAMLVSSINTASNMLVDAVKIPQQKFVEHMNTTAATLGLPKTRFTNVDGTDPKNIGTAREFATLYKKAVTNLEIGRVLGMKEYRYTELIDHDSKPNHYDVHSNDIALNTNLPFTVINSKTGYLYEAGANLAMVVERQTDKKKFLIITMGNAYAGQRFSEPEKLTLWAIKNF